MKRNIRIVGLFVASAVAVSSCQTLKNLRAPYESDNQVPENLFGNNSATSSGKYKKADGKLLIGTFVSNNKGFGFVELEDREDDLFIPGDKTNGAFHKDTVQVMLLPPGNGKRQEAAVVKIIDRGI